MIFKRAAFVNGRVAEAERITGEIARLRRLCVQRWRASVAEIGDDVSSQRVQEAWRMGMHVWATSFQN